MDPNLEQMKSDYPYFRKFVYDKLKEEFDRTLPPLEGDDLEKIIKDEGAVPLDAFIHEIESPEGA
jgi:hypothetical protein